jgi:hypothetical protein
MLIFHAQPILHSFYPHSVGSLIVSYCIFFKKKLTCTWYASYLSIVLVVIGGFVSFGTFTLASCQRWYYVPPIFKGTYHVFSNGTDTNLSSAVLQVMVSQFVLGIR